MPCRWLLAVLVFGGLLVASIAKGEEERLKDWLLDLELRPLDEQFQAKEDAKLFELFLKAFGRDYASDPQEHARRLEIFSDNLRHIRRRNAETLGFKLGINQYADMTLEESMPTALPSIETFVESLPLTPNNLYRPAPAEWDWREQNAVTKVGYQGSCNSCWSFAAAAVAETAHYLKTKNLTKLSEQQIVDCASAKEYPGTWGCVNGQPENGILYIRDHGAQSFDSYPYAGVQGECKYNPQAIVTKVEQLIKVPKKNETALKEAVYYGVVAVGVTRGSQDWRFYRGGIFTGACDGTPNHVVALVGYGKENGQAFWIIKNSEGPTWGEKGFMRLLRQEKGTGPGTCGVALTPFGAIP
ncbi:putative Senescence-associated gene 12 protein [Balamuthia mandrillaris]